MVEFFLIASKENVRPVFEDKRILVLKGEASEGIRTGRGKVGPVEQALHDFHRTFDICVPHDVINILTGSAKNNASAGFKHVRV